MIGTLNSAVTMAFLLGALVGSSVPSVAAPSTPTVQERYGCRSARAAWGDARVRPICPEPNWPVVTIPGHPYPISTSRR